MEQENNTIINEDYIESNHIRDSNMIIERSKDFLTRSLSHLVLDNFEIDWIDSNHTVNTISFDKVFKFCDERAMNNKYQEISKNLKSILKFIYKELLTIKKGIESDFKELIREVEDIDQYASQKEAETEKLLTELEKRDNEIEKLREEINQSKHSSLQHQIDNLSMILVSLAQNKPIPHEVFNEDILSNVSEKHGLRFKEDEEGPKTNENKNQISANINAEDSKDYNIRIKKLHSFITDQLKDYELYPIHKVNILEAQGYYRNLWEVQCIKYDLEEKDMPDFINNLEEYKDKPDDYFDSLEDKE